MKSNELDEGVSELMENLFSRYDKNAKGFLDLEDFTNMVKKHSKNTAEANKILGIDEN